MSLATGGRQGSPSSIPQHPDLVHPSALLDKRTWSQADPGQGSLDAWTRFSLPRFSVLDTAFPSRVYQLFLGTRRNVAQLIS